MYKAGSAEPKATQNADPLQCDSLLLIVYTRRSHRNNFNSYFLNNSSTFRVLASESPDFIFVFNYHVHCELNRNRDGNFIIMELNMRAGNLIDGITDKLVTPKLITNLQKLVMLLNTISFAFIISHPVFYILAMSEARKSLTSTADRELKKPMTVKVPINLHVMYSLTIFSNMLLVVLAWYAGSKLMLFAALITMGSLITEVFLFSKRNIIGTKADEIFIPKKCGRYEKNYDNNSLFYCYNRQLFGIFGMFLFLTGTALW